MLALWGPVIPCGFFANDITAPTIQRSNDPPIADITGQGQQAHDPFGIWHSIFRIVNGRVMNSY